MKMTKERFEEIRSAITHPSSCHDDLHRELFKELERERAYARYRSIEANAQLHRFALVWLESHKAGIAGPLNKWDDEMLDGYFSSPEHWSADLQLVTDSADIYAKWEQLEKLRFEALKESMDLDLGER
jgi:hypothetical protein